MHKLCNVQKTCLPEAVYLVDFEDRKLRVSEFNIHLLFKRAKAPAFMQFLSEGRYVANVVDGKANFYGRGGTESARRSGYGQG